MTREDADAEEDGEREGIETTGRDERGVARAGRSPRGPAFAPLTRSYGDPCIERALGLRRRRRYASGVKYVNMYERTTRRPRAMKQVEAQKLSDR
jgi:hypothetical protein